MTQTKRVEFLVHENGLCRKVFIPRKYCIIILQGQSKDYLEMHKLGADVEIENLSGDMSCQKRLKS